MPSMHRERTMWRMAAVISFVTALGFFGWCQYLYFDTADMTHGPLWAGISGAFCMLTAISCMVTLRILKAAAGRSEGVSATLWKAMAYLAPIVGLAILIGERIRTFHVAWMTSNMKAVYAAGAFTIIAGVVALVGERCVKFVAGGSDRQRSATA